MNRQSSKMRLKTSIQHRRLCSCWLAILVATSQHDISNASQSSRQMGNFWDNLEDLQNYVSESPSVAATDTPSYNPTSVPTNEQSEIPSSVPSMVPTVEPSITPSSYPSQRPTASPTIMPSLLPSQFPTTVPSEEPTMSPSGLPSFLPTSIPSLSPSVESPVFNVHLTLKFYHTTELMDENEIKAFETTTSQFISECLIDSIPNEKAERISTEVLLQQEINSILEVQLVINGEVNHAYRNTIDSIVINSCFQSNYQDIASLLDSSRKTPPSSNSSNWNSIFIFSGVGSAFLVLFIIGIFFVKRKRNSNSIVRVKQYMKEFELERDRNMNEKDEFFDMPRIMEQIYENRSFNEIEDQAIPIENSNINIPETIGAEGVDDTLSRRTGVSSMTDNNQYGRSQWHRQGLQISSNTIQRQRPSSQFDLDLDDLLYEEENFNEQPSRSITSNLDDIEEDDVEEGQIPPITCMTTTNASSEILMGLPITIESAMIAKKVSNKAVRNAIKPNTKRSMNHEEIRGVMETVLNDICRVNNSGLSNNAQGIPRRIGVIDYSDSCSRKTGISSVTDNFVKYDYS